MCPTEERPPLALNELIQNSLPWLHAYLRLKAGPLLRAQESCSDLAQSVCREILADADDLEFRSESAFRSCAALAADRKLVERHRFHTRRKRDAQRNEDVDPAVAVAYARIPTPSEAADLREEIALLEASFDELAPDSREVILLFYLAGLSHEEIGLHMGRTASASRNLLSRALARLARLMRARGA